MTLQDTATRRNTLQHTATQDDDPARQSTAPRPISLPTDALQFHQMSAKKAYTSAKEPCLTAKEPCITAKEDPHHVPISLPIGTAHSHCDSRRMQGDSLPVSRAYLNNAPRAHDAPRNNAQRADATWTVSECTTWMQLDTLARPVLIGNVAVDGRGEVTAGLTKEERDTAEDTRKEKSRLLNTGGSSWLSGLAEEAAAKLVTSWIGSTRRDTHRITTSDHVNYISSKEHNLSAKEPCISAKEPYTSAKEPYTSANGPYISAQDVNTRGSECDESQSQHHLCSPPGNPCTYVSRELERAMQKSEADAHPVSPAAAHMDARQEDSADDFPGLYTDFWFHLYSCVYTGLPSTSAVEGHATLYTPEMSDFLGAMAICERVGLWADLEQHLTSTRFLRGIVVWRDLSCSVSQALKMYSVLFVWVGGWGRSWVRECVRVSVCVFVCVCIRVRLFSRDVTSCTALAFSWCYISVSMVNICGSLFC